MNRLCLLTFMCICSFQGCASFKTLALYRFDNDSVVPECNNEKLQGIPVKLKVPSHVRVLICEQQLILADSAEAKKEKKAALDSASQGVKDTDIEIKRLQNAVTTTKNEHDAVKAVISSLSMKISITPAGDELKELEQIKANAEKEESEKAEASERAQRDMDAELPGLTLKRKKQIAARDVAADDLATGYSLVSFTPQQLVVHTELEYTDKVFLVDFRRPAAGILNLSEASMDDQQYFSKIQADVTERTLEDVGKALDTLQGPLKPPKKPDAAPTSAADAVDQPVNEVNFQESIVATKRFDIAEAGWEERMTCFINQKLAYPCGMPVATADAATEIDFRYTK